MTIEQQINCFKALADKNRWQVMQLLDQGEMCACHLLEELSVTQPTLSHHMKVLQDADLVLARKDGKWMHYKRNDNTLKQLREVL